MAHENKTERRDRRVQVKHTCTGKREEVNGVGKKSNAQSYWPFRIPGEPSDRVWRLFSEYRSFCAETDFDQNIKRLGQDRIKYKIFYTKKRLRVFRRRWSIASIMFRNMSTERMWLIQQIGKGFRLSSMMAPAKFFRKGQGFSVWSCLCFQCFACVTGIFSLKHEERAQNAPSLRYGGDKGSRTPDLLNAIQALYQLSYAPIGLLFYHICQSL